MHGTKACIAPGAFVFQSTRAVPARSLRTLPRLPHTPLRASIPNQGFIQDPLHTSAARPLAPPHPEAFGSGGPLGPTASSTDDDQPLPEVFGHRFRFEDAYWYINAAYWTTLLVSVLTGNKWLDGLSHFRNFVSAMALASAIFAGYFVIRWLADVRRHMVSKERHRDFQGALRYGWRALFWLAFVLWYTTGPVEAVLEWSGTPGAIMCTYGLVLAASSALLVGSWTFFGEPQVPRRMATTGPYALLRHPQALGNMLFLVGFSFAGACLSATAAFLASFYLYCTSVLPKEEAMLEQAFGAKYRHYKERVPAFAWGLILLLVVEAVLMWRFREYAIPIDLSMPR